MKELVAAAGKGYLKLPPSHDNDAGRGRIPDTHPDADLDANQRAALCKVYKSETHLPGDDVLSRVAVKLGRRELTKHTCRPMQFEIEVPGPHRGREIWRVASKFIHGLRCGARAFLSKGLSASNITDVAHSCGEDKLASPSKVSLSKETASMRYPHQQ